MPKVGLAKSLLKQPYLKKNKIKNRENNFAVRKIIRGFINLKLLFNFYSIFVDFVPELAICYV